ncbi:uncharacterized protein V6R79_005064 [Siganus canaliculatus]
MMSERSISLLDLLNVSIGTPHMGAVNFEALHALLHAVLTQLDIQEMKTQWRDTPLRDGPPDPQQEHPTGTGSGIVEDTVEQGDHPGSELQERVSSSPTPSASSPRPVPNVQRGLGSRIQTCEEDVSRVLTLIEELHQQRDCLKEELEELRLQHQVFGTETVSSVEKCCHRVDNLEETVRTVRASVQDYPDPEELSECVTWDAMRSALLGERERLPEQERVYSEVLDGATAVKPTVNTSHPRDSSRTPTPDSTRDTGGPRKGQETTDTQSSTGPSLVQPGASQQTPPKAGPAAADTPLPVKAGGPERHPETVEALRNIGRLREEFSELEARVVVLEEGKVDRTLITELRELIADRGSQDVSSHLMDQLKQQGASLDHLRSEQEKSGERVVVVQGAISQLEAAVDRLHEASGCWQTDSREKQSHIEELYRILEELEEKKADKHMVESEIKADKSVLESKVSRLQFDSVTEQLNTMFHELLNKVSGQEQDWHKVVAKLSTEMENKLNRMELDSVKKQLEGRWRNIHQKLQAQGAPEHEDAAALRRQLVDRFHCLSCDRPVKCTPGSHSVKLPSYPAFPAHKSIRPFTVYALEQFRQQYRSERISELTDYNHLSVSRSCGGSHTVTSASRRRSVLQSVKLQTQVDLDSLIQSQEVDIIGLDGHIYKGRLNASAARNTETRLPTISTKDGGCKTKEKAKSSLPYKPAPSPESRHNTRHDTPVQPAHSAKSGQSSRSASSSSGRDRPLSTLACLSQSSMAATSAAADSCTEPQLEEPVDL